MRQLLFTLTLLLGLTSFGQNAGGISGSVIDLDSDNQSPLLFATVMIKETGAKVMTDENGHFKFNGIQNGDYTLVCSFTGYATKEVKAKVLKSKDAQIKLYLEPSTLSLDDFALVMAANKKVDSDEKEQANNN